MPLPINSPPEDTSSLEAYNAYITSMRTTEYPNLYAPDAETQAAPLYLDHAGSTLPSATQLSRFHVALLSRLWGNPHAGGSGGGSAGSVSAQLVDDTRASLLHFVRADPALFDLVFVANATAAFKLVGEALRERSEGFGFVCHGDAHTSLVGLREWAVWQRCLDCDAEVERWFEGEGEDLERAEPVLFAYPAQSNMNGRRLPLEWASRGRQTRAMGSGSKEVYTLLDAAAYASTAQLDLGDAQAAPDFTVLSLYKIFGFPDLGALIVKKDVASLFDHIRYFGGGTVDMVVCLQEHWHAKKTGALHERLEDGTLPFHSIVALNSAITTHEELYGTLDRISNHTADLARRLYEGLASLRHANGQDVCTIYRHPNSSYGDAKTQGPIVAFNLRDAHGRWISNAEVEKLAAVNNVHLRTGGVCNPGGIATALNLAPWEMRENFSAGQRCGSDHEIANGKPTGIVRVSLGAMSTRDDVERFVAFVHDFFVYETMAMPEPLHSHSDRKTQRLKIESLTVYPIKSGGGFKIPPNTHWDVRPEGLAWDREWCIVHHSTGKALSQKQHPRMALLRPQLDFNAGVLRVGMIGRYDEITIPLSRNPALYTASLLPTQIREQPANVCGDLVETLAYTSPAIAEFFSKSLGVPCTLARFSKGAGRHCKPHLLRDARSMGSSRSSSISPSSSSSPAPRPIHLSNESPILTITRSSLNALNERILARGGKLADPAAFRANIVLSEPSSSSSEDHACPQPWAEDSWHSMQIHSTLTNNMGGPSPPITLDFLAGCRRCQMVCVDQKTAERRAEPFVTLAKMRRIEGRVLFGVHTALALQDRDSAPRICVGDGVVVFGGD